MAGAQYSHNQAADPAAHTVPVGGALRAIFHETCPHPIRYRDDQNVYDTKAFYAGFQVWVTSKSAHLLTLTPTGHTAECRCCLNFRHAYTNYEAEFSSLLGDEFQTRRISRIDIKRWGNMLKQDSFREAFDMFQKIQKAWIILEETPHIIEVAVKSEQLSPHNEAVDSNSSLDSEPEEIPKTNLEKRRDLKAAEKRRHGRRASKKQKRATSSQSDSGSRDVPRSVESSTGVLEDEKTRRTTKPYKNGSSKARMTRSRRQPSRVLSKIRRPVDTVVDISTENNIIVHDMTTGKAVTIPNTFDPVGQMYISRYMRNFILLAAISRQAYNLFECKSYDMQCKEILKGDVARHRASIELGKTFPNTVGLRKRTLSGSSPEDNKPMPNTSSDVT